MRAKLQLIDTWIIVEKLISTFKCNVDGQTRSTWPPAQAHRSPNEAGGKLASSRPICREVVALLRAWPGQFCVHSTVWYAICG